MFNLNYLPFHFSVFLIVGIFLGNLFNFSLTIIITAIIVSLMFLVYFNYRAKISYKLPVLFVVFTAVLFVNIGILNITIQKPQYKKNHYVNHITATNHSVLRIDKILKPNKFYDRYEAQIIQLNNKQTKGKILVNINKDSLRKQLDIDDLLYTSNQFKEVQKVLNPYQFNYQEYLRKHQIYHQIVLKQNDFLIIDSNKKTLKGQAQILRKKINSELEEFNFSKKELAIVNALLLGQRQDITKEQFRQYRDAGAIHILAVSGLHIGILLLFLNFLFKPIEKLKNGKNIKLIVIIMCLWSYAFLAGLSASIVRAVTMFTAIAIGLASNRPTEVKNSLVMSLFFLLLINPFYLFDVGFQLSYAAVFSIVWIQPIFSGFLKPKGKFLRFFWSLLTVTFAAQLGILPLTLYYFHQFQGSYIDLYILPYYQ